MKTKLKLTPEQKAMLSGRQPRVYASYELREAEVEGSEGRFLRGRAVPYDAWTDTGWYRERVMPGAFAKSIKESAHALPLLLFHDSRTFPVGAAEEWSEEPDGLVGLWRMDEDDPDAMQARGLSGHVHAGAAEWSADPLCRTCPACAVRCGARRRIDRPARALVSARVGAGPRGWLALRRDRPLRCSHPRCAVARAVVCQPWPSGV